MGSGGAAPGIDSAAGGRPVPGLAIDFTGPNGDLVRSQDSPTFIWLWGNAARFGLYNLPSEPWHWSTTGG